MKKYVVLLSFICFVLGAAEPVYHWNFEDEPHDGIGTQKKRLYTRSIQPGIGCNNSGGLLCGEGQRAHAANCNDFWSEFTVELRFKPSHKSAAGTLFTFNRHSYGRGYFGIKIDTDGRISAEFLVRDDEAKKILKTFRVQGEKNNFIPDRWHLLRVASASGGKLQIWLDGKLYQIQEKSFGFNDLNGIIPKGYPLISLGFDIGYGKSSLQEFPGVIDDVKVWSCIEEPEIGEISAGTASVTDHNMSITDQFEWSVPFRTLDVATELEGAYTLADDKFVKAAATAALRKDDKNLYVRYNCPIPEGTQLKLDGKSVWEGDCVEFFIVSGHGGYLQYAANPNGKNEVYHWLKPGIRNLDFKSVSAFKSEIKPDAYTLEMTIPLDELRLSGALVCGNFTRETNSGKILSSWANCGGSFHNVEGFGKFFIDGRKNYFTSLLDNKRKECAGAKPSPLRDNINKQLDTLAEKIAVNGEKAEFYDSLSSAFHNIEQSLIQLSLDGKSHILWAAPVWSNNITFSVLAQPLEKISLSAPRNSRVLYGLALTNLSEKPYLGQLKLLTEEKEKYDFYHTGKRNILTAKISFMEGVPIEDRSGQLLYDPITPLPLNTLVRTAAKSSVPLWLEIDTTGMNPGVYTGLLMLKAANSGFTDEKLNFELKVTEVDFGKIKLDNFNYNYIPLFCAGNKKMMHILDRYDINYIYAGTPGQKNLDIYPEFDKEGNIIRERFEELDKLLAGYDKPYERKIIFYTAWSAGWGTKLDGKSQLKTDTPAWNNAMKNFIVALEKHLTTKHGFKSDQIVIYPEDESSGDIDDLNSHVARAYNYCKMIKSTGTQMRVMLNPHMRAFEVTSKNLKKLAEVVDIFELYRPKLTPQLAEFAKTLNKELWIYSILVNTNQPEVYRRLSWENMRDGFSPVVAFWHFDGSFSGGDGFNSRDYNPRRKTIRTADYSAIYVDFDHETYVPSRRSEAHYQGLLDRKAYEYAKQQGVPETELQEMIATALNGDMETMNKMREAMLTRAQGTK